MGHYLVYVITPGEPDDQGNELERALAPFNECAPNCKAPKWDWYQLGGRWTGVLDKEYDPNKDPKHQAPCELCNSTGIRKDKFVDGPCNGCNGTGTKTLWPTSWQSHGSDQMQVGQLKTIWEKDLCPYAILLDEEWREQDFTREINDWVNHVDSIIPTIPDHYWVSVVDCHS
jgi:hypothetical protein|tara:strand:+ start:1881 stop:2396 length:516 start_codon:yes stop_codon:yes gene_type:complete